MLPASCMALGMERWLLWRGSEGCSSPSPRCTSFLVLKAQLELQQSELELSHFDLQQALFLLESDAGESLLWPWRGMGGPR